MDNHKLFKYKTITAFIATITIFFTFLFYFFTQEQSHRLLEIQNIHKEIISKYANKEFSDESFKKFLFSEDLQQHQESYEESLENMLRTFAFAGVITLLFLWYILFLYKKREFADAKTNAILNAQENIVVLSRDGKKLITCNSAFLRFFNFKSIEEFSQKHNCVCDLFLPQNGYIQPEVEGKNWVSYIRENPQIKHFAKMQKNNNEYIFRVSVNLAYGSHDETHEFVITFEDVTQERLLQKELEDERNLFSDGPVLTIEWSPQDGWPIRYISQNSQEVLGYTPEQMKDVSFVYADLIHPDDIERVFEEVTNYIKCHTLVYEQSYRLRLSDGSYKWFYDFTKLIWSKDGELLSIRGYMFDQSELKASEASLIKERQRLANIIEGTNVGTWEWNVQTGETIFNDKWAEIIGYRLEEISPTTINTWIKFAHEEDLKNSSESLQNCLSKKAPYYEAKCRMKHKDGSLIWVYDRGSVSEWDENGEALMMSGTHTLIDKEERLTEELLSSNKKLEEANKAKSQFLANMSHEIRTPMNAIIGLSELMKDSPLNDKQFDFLTKIHSSSKMLLRIINDILDFSKLEANKLELENCTFETETIFKQLNVLFSASFEKKNLVLLLRKKGMLPSLLVGDELRIEQVLANLLSNALKFTHEGEVIFEMELKQKVSNTKALIGFSVKDSGIGISHKEQTKLFRAFSQADVSTTRKYGGTGLGLMISSKLVEAMGSYIVVRSKIGVGSTFSFDLLLKVASWETQCHTPHNRINQEEYKVDLSGVHILLIEDNEINQEVASMILKRANAEITIANNGQEGVHTYFANPQKYTLILMDLQMPLMDGYEATRLIREQNKDIPIIALTAAAMIEDRKKVLDAGMNEHLSKPIDTDELYEKVAMFVNKKKLDAKSANFVQHMLTRVQASDMIEQKEREELLLHLKNHLKSDEYHTLKEALDTFEFDTAIKILQKFTSL